MANAKTFFNPADNNLMTEGSIRLKQLEFTIQSALKNDHPINVEDVRSELCALILDSNNGEPLKVEDGTSGLFNRRNMNEVLANTPYLALQDVKIYIPRGMKKSFLETGIALLDIAKQLHNLEKDVLDPLVKYTALLIEDPEQLERPFPYRKVINFDELNDILTKHVQVPSEVVQAKYGDVIRKNNEWYQIGELNASIQEVLNKERLNSLIEKHDRVRELSKLLDETLQKHNADLQSSAETIQAFVDYTRYAANALTFYGYINTFAIQYNTALMDNLARLKDIAD